MAREKKPLDPPVYVANADGDEIPVKISPLSWRGLKELRDVIEGADLQLPTLATASVSAWIKSQQDDLSALQDEGDPETFNRKYAIASQKQNLGLYQAIVDLLGENLNVLYSWLLKCPPIAESLVKGATGLNETQLDELTAAEFTRAAKASLQSLIDSGLLQEIGDFFVVLLRRTLAVGASKTEESQPLAASDAQANLAESASA